MSDNEITRANLTVNVATTEIHTFEIAARASSILNPNKRKENRRNIEQFLKNENHESVHSLFEKYLLWIDFGHHQIRFTK